MDPSEVEVAWLAGILEGEGSFMTTKNHVGGKVYRYPQIVVNMTDRDVIERVASLFGNSTYRIPIYLEGRKQSYKAQTQGANAARWMERLRPLMGERRGARIDEILTEYGNVVPTSERRRESCRIAANARYARERAEGKRAPK